MKTFGTIVIILGIAFEILLTIACLGGGDMAPTAFTVGGFLIFMGCQLRNYGQGTGQRKVSSALAAHPPDRTNCNDLTGQMLRCTPQEAFTMFFEPWLQRRIAVAIFLFSDQKACRTQITAISRKEQTVSIELEAKGGVEINLRNAMLSYEPGQTGESEHAKAPEIGGLLTIQFSGATSQIVFAESSVALGLATISATDVSFWAQRCGFTRDDDTPTCGQDERNPPR